jgi:hypothetical protein
MLSRLNNLWWAGQRMMLGHSWQLARLLGKLKQGAWMHDPVEGGDQAAV